MTENFIEQKIDFDENSDGLIVIKSQDIPQWWIDDLKEARFQSKFTPAREMHRVASVPQAVVEKWLSEGYDVHKEPVAKSVAKLKAEGLDYFVTSDKV